MGSREEDLRLLAGGLTREVRAKQELEAEYRVRAAHRAGASPGGMGVRLFRQGCTPAPGFTIHYGQPQAASGWNDAQTPIAQQAARSVGLF